MNFDISASPGIASVSWDMGDATTSTQTSFTHKYSTKGKKTVKALVSLTGGGTCTATKVVTVYELPQFNIKEKKDNNYCLYQNNICLLDSSTGGDSGVSLKKRIIIWDDGSQTTDSNLSQGDLVCHHYNNSGTFKITIELTNDKGCKLEKFMSITILKDIVPKLSFFSYDNDIVQYCDSAKAEFYDDTRDTATIDNRIYDWGDGSPKITTKSKHLSHTYKQAGWYKIRLSLIQKNGCITTKDSLIEIKTYSVKFNITKNGRKKCEGDLFRITQNDSYSGAYYSWYIDNQLYDYDYDLKYTDMSPPIGRHLISLELSNNGCFKTFKYDTIEVIGAQSRVFAYNGNQYSNKDSVYFRVDTKRYGVGRLSYFWDFGDDKAPQCTTSRAKGINVNNNCNYSTDSVAVHKYVNGLKRTYKLSVYDSLTGCVSQTFSGEINVDGSGDEPPIFEMNADRRCIGNKSGYNVNFSSNLSGLVKVKVNLDSTCDKDRWSSRFISSWAYTSTCDPDGWVTVGFSMIYGDPKVYDGYDSSKFHIDSSRLVYDTIWKHKWFKLEKDPLGTFNAKIKCLNQVIEPTVLDSPQKKIAYTIWTWGDNSPADTTYYAASDSVIRAPSHKYNKAGSYLMNYYIEGQNRCYAVSEQKIIIGFNLFMAFDTVICPGSTVWLKDSMSYNDIDPKTKELFQSKNFWHIPSRKLAGKEEFKWDFDDGRGFVTDTANPVITFPTSGFYNVKLAAKDSTGCWDTLSKRVNVGDVHAGIKKLNRRIICDGIVQLRDSSYSDFKPPVDSITSYYWDFGDGGNPSYLQNPFHYYSTFGNYTIFQKVSNSRGCTDTAYIHITIEGPVAKFDIVGDTVACAPFTAHFDNTSVKVRDYIWYFGDPLKTKLSTNKDTNVSFTYTKPGVYYIYLFGSDSVVNPNAGNAIYYCKSFFPDTNTLGHPVRRITVLPAPKANFSVGPIQCNNAPIVVTDQSDSLYTLYRWKIKNVDSVETSSKSAELRTADTGNFVIQYTPWFNSSARACYDTVRKTIRVSGIQAEFDLFKDSSSCPEYTFVNTSQNYQSAIWNLNDPKLDPSKNMRTDEHFTFRYSEKGNFSPCLMVVNNNGCKDTLCKEVMVNVTKKLVIPNVFTPGNFDKLNDAFDIQAEGLAEYHLSIYNRWGQLLFHSNIDGSGDDGNNWRGRPNITSPIYPDGTYYYTFTYKFKCESKTQEAHGTITLIGTRD